MPTLEEFRNMSREDRAEFISKHPPQSDNDDDEDNNVCRECGNTPETGTCYYCKAD